MSLLYADPVLEDSLSQIEEEVPLPNAA